MRVIHFHPRNLSLNRTWLVKEVNIGAGLPLLASGAHYLVGVLEHHVQVACLQSGVRVQPQSLDPIIGRVLVVFLDGGHFRREVKIRGKIFF